MQKMEIIGCGSYGKVYQLPCLTVACKRILCKTEGDVPPEALRELAIYQRIQRDKEPSPQIIRFIGASKSVGWIDLYLEYVEGGDLASRLRNGPTFSAEQVRHSSHQILLGVEYLHRNNIIHRDLKPSNILLGSEGHLKITDFGMSRVYASGTPCTPVVCTSAYRPPEIFCHEMSSVRSFCYGFEVDMWSVGCILAELPSAVPLFSATGDSAAKLEVHASVILRVFEIPCDDINVIEVLSESGKRRQSPSAETLNISSDSLVNLIQRLLVLNKDHRITAEQSLKHDYFVGMDTLL